MTTPSQHDDASAQQHPDAAPPAPAGHEPVPVRESMTRSPDAGPGDPLNPDDYPITAVCETCGKLINSQAFLEPWKHRPAPAPAPA